MIVWQRPNLLLLDEPTNHLDLATREALSVALNEFEGTVMLVSHDRALLRAVCDEFWLVSRGGIDPFDGDLDDYQRYLLEVAKTTRQEQKDAQRSSASSASDAPAPVQHSKGVHSSAAAAPVAASTTATQMAQSIRSPEQRKQDALRRQQIADKVRPFKKELDTIDKRMAALNTERETLETRLSQPLKPYEIAEAGKRLKVVNDELGTLEARWLTLSEAIEEANAV
jgi:ATP-binding cassette subfamily F protein 3